MRCTDVVPLFITIVVLSSVCATNTDNSSLDSKSTAARRLRGEATPIIASLLEKLEQSRPFANAASGHPSEIDERELALIKLTWPDFLRENSEALEVPEFTTAEDLFKNAEVREGSVKQIQAAWVQFAKLNPDLLKKAEAHLSAREDVINTLWRNRIAGIASTQHKTQQKPLSTIVTSLLNKVKQDIGNPRRIPQYNPAELSIVYQTWSKFCAAHYWRYAPPHPLKLFRTEFVGGKKQIQTAWLEYVLEHQDVLHDAEDTIRNLAALAKKREHPENPLFYLDGDDKDWLEEMASMKFAR